DIYIYLSKIERYPVELNNIKLKPYPPSHLPPQHTVIIKKHNHHECEIKCRHCNGPHVSTDYKCPVINQYRGELIYEVRKRSDKLPDDVQLFIPSEYRNSNERNKVLYNKKTQQQKK
ncbi:unnamed protein product, partial [Didymodactylos carnosus]